VHALAQGEVIKAGDFTLARRPKAEVAPGVLTNVEQAIGLAARRALTPGRALRLGDLHKPELVARNESVSISYEVPGILLTMRGQALEAGAQGDVINVLNVQSKKPIQATITGPGRVTVAATTPRLAANAIRSPSRNSVR
jgi:flagella basal body P-ring formation protein FlgA